MPSRTFGLPCKHKIAHCLHFDPQWKLPIELTHPHWFFRRQDGPPAVPLPPLPQEAAVLEPASTRRNPSLFELVDQPQPSTTTRGRCRPPGSKNKSKSTQNATQQQPVDHNLQGINHEALQQLIERAVANVMAVARQKPAAAPPPVPIVPPLPSRPQISTPEPQAHVESGEEFDSFLDDELLGYLDVTSTQAPSNTSNLSSTARGGASGRPLGTSGGRGRAESHNQLSRYQIRDNPALTH